MKGLQDLGVADNTLVVFSSDNGPEEIFIKNAGHTGVGSPGPFRGRKRSLYEGGVRVPFIVRWPGHVPAGRVDDEAIVAGCDLLPTVAKLTGATVPQGTPLDGEDVSDILLGKSRSRTRPLMWEWRFNIAGHPSNISPRLAIRDGDWKLLLNPDKSRVELYDVRKDRMQVDNVAGQHVDVVERLSGKVIEWSKTLPEGPSDPGNAENEYPWPKGK
jgi:arylsulfatase A-like enzyme